MSKMLLDELTRDAVDLARRGDLTVLEVATDFGVGEETVHWRRRADIEEVIKDGMSSA